MKSPEKTGKPKTAVESIVHENNKDKLVENDHGNIAQFSAC